MPDISPVTEVAQHPSLNDIMAAVGVCIATVITTLGLKRGARDRIEMPASPSPESTGIALGILEHGFQRDIAADTARTAEACEALVDTVNSLLKDVEQEKQDRKDRSTDRRLNTLEGKLDVLLERIDQAENASQRRHIERGQDKHRG